MTGKLYIWGWWQGNNLGDNWIRKTLGVLFPDAVFIDTSVESFPKGSFVICGGGGLFIYDVISPWNDIQNDISYGMLGLGAEFPHDSLDAVKVFDKSRFFYVRDQYSLDCMHLHDVERSYDLTFALPLKWSDPGDVDGSKVFFVWRDGHELLANEKFRDYIRSEEKDYLFEWKSVISEFFNEITEDDFQTRDDNIEERISDSGFVISGRYHGIVAAIQKGLPFIAIDICPKIRALLKECGLEEYCIKISEVDKIGNLIRKAQNEIDEIRTKEAVFRKTAFEVLQEHIQNARFEILKVLKPLNVIHYGSYWMKENDVVNVMADDLNDICNLEKIDLKVYSEHPDRRIISNIDTPNGKQCIIGKKNVLKDIKKKKADVVVLNSGGLYFEDDTFHELNKRNITTVGISLSDPDVFPYNGKIYADKYDIFYTNSKYSLLDQYPDTGANIRLMPFAASIKHHYYMPEVERIYDVVIVAHAREDRIPIVKKLKKICSVGTYGGGWEESLGVVNGIEHVKAINSGKMYISFARTVAGYDNVKVGLFEAMACNQVVITSYMDELQDYFEIGKEILCYRSDEELIDLIKYYVKNEEARENIRKNGYKRFLNEHTYEKRWNKALRDIYQIRKML